MTEVSLKNPENDRNNTLLNNPWVKDTKQEVRKMFWVEWKWKTTHKNLWYAAELVCREKFVTPNAFICKEDSNQWFS